MNPRRHFTLRLDRHMWFPIGCALLVWVLGSSRVSLAHGFPTGFEEYFILGNETQTLAMFEDIQNTQGTWTQISSEITVVATTDNQVIYYDHWEDGYEADILHPTQTSTEVYGDRVPSTDVLRAGDIVYLNSNGGTGIHQFISIPRDRRVLRYDSSDRLMSLGGPIDIVHALTPAQIPWIGGALEIYPVGAWGEAYSYTIPVGEDLYDGPGGYWSDFQHVWLVIQALDNNTTVYIDNGDSAIAVQMNQGQSYASAGFLDNSTVGIPAIRVYAGTTILANKPIQGALVTGRETNQTRFYTLIPDSALGTEYVVPVPNTTTDEPAELFMYNPTQRNAQITAYDSDARSGTVFDLAPATAVAYRDPLAAGHVIPLFSTVRLHADHPLATWVSANTNQTGYDWGFSLIPSRFAGQDYYVPWAPGSDGIVNNASPVWIASLRDNTTFRIDYSSPTIDGVIDYQFVLDALQIRRIYDPTDGDNTGMHIQADKPFLAAWGVDPSTANDSLALDMGYLIPPLNSEWLDPVLTLAKTPEIQTLPATGGTASFSLRAQTGDYAVGGVNITDTLPISWTYVSGSAYVTYPNGSAANVEPTVLSQSLSWPLSVGLAPHQSLTISYQAQISIPGGLADTVFDDLESGGYGGGSGWSAPWTEDETACSATCVENTTASTYGPPHSGSYHLAISSAGAVSRHVDLSGFRHPTLRLWKRLDALETGDSFELRLYDGLNWTTAQTWTSRDAQDTYTGEQVDLSPYVDSPAFAFEIRGGAANTLNDFLYLDDVQIFDADVIQRNTAQATGTHGDHLFSSWDESSVLLSPLALSLEVSDMRTAPLRTLTYTLHYTNSSALSLTHASMQQILPADTNFESASSGATYLASAHTVVWGLAPTMTLLPDASGTLTVVVSVDQWAQDGQILRAVGYASSAQTIESASNPVETIVQAPYLVIHKAGPSAANPGQFITYTIDYANTGALTATGVLITDVIPLSTAYQPGTLAMDSGGGFVTLSDLPDQDAGEIVDRTIVLRPGRALAGQLAPGETGHVQFSVQISPTLSALDAIANYATVTRDLGLPQRSTLAPTEITDLTLEKSADREVAGPGMAIAYTILLRNADVPPETDVCVQDAIPAHTQYLAATAHAPSGFTTSYSTDGGQTWSSTEPAPLTLLTDIRWCALSVAGLANLTLGYEARVEDPLSADHVIIANQALVKSLQTPLAHSNEVHIPTVDLHVSQTASSTSVSPGERLTVTISFSNTGSAPIAGLVITDRVPDHTTLVPNSLSEGGISDGQVITWTTTLPSPGSVQFAVVISDPVPAGIETIANVVQLLGDQEFTATNTLTISLVANAELAVLKSNGLDAVHLGDLITYTITLSNAGHQGASGVVLTDALPELVSFVPGSASAGGVYVSTTHQVVWTFPLPLDGGSTTTRTFQGTVGLSIPEGVSQITNTVVVSDDGANGDTPQGNTAVDVDALLGVPDLQLSKSDGGITAEPGAIVTYTLSYTNAGAQDATGVWLTETVPAHATFVAAASSPGWSCAAGTTCTLSIGDLPTDTSGAALFAVQIVSPLPAGVEVLANSAIIQDDGTNGADPNPNDNRASDSTPITAEPDLQLAKSDGGITTGPGAVVTYTLSYTNAGDQGASGVWLTETLPAHATFVAAASAPGWSCAAGTTCTLAIGDLPNGTGGVALFAVQVVSPLPAGVEALANSAIIQDDGTSGADPHPDDNQASDSTPITAAPDLQLAKSDGGITAEPGAVVTYTLSYTNAGDQDATGVWLTETVPAHATFVAAASAPAWSCVDGAPAGTTCRLAIGDLPGGTGGAALFAVQIVSPLPAGVEALVNSAIIQDDGTNGVDPHPDDNQASDSTPITAAPDLHVAKSAGVISTSPGSYLYYTITVRNVGDQEATGIGLTDTLPDHTLFIQASGGGTLADRTVTWPPFVLEGNKGATYSVTLLVDDPLPDGVDWITNTVSAIDDGANGVDINPYDNVFADVLEVEYHPVLAIAQASPATASVGDTVVLTFTVSHDETGDGSPIRSVSVDDSVAGTADYVEGDSNDNQRLEIGERWIFAVGYTIPPTVPNPLIGQAAAMGYDRDNDAITNTATHSTTISYHPTLRLTKDGPGTALLGEIIEYRLMIANVSYMPTSARPSGYGDGSPIRQVVVTDSIASPVYQSGDDDDGLLEQGEVWIYTATYTIQDADPDPLINLAMVTAEDGNGNALTDSDTHQLDIDYAPAIEIQRQGLAAGTVGDTLALTFTVSHSASLGDGSAISGLVITDTLLDTIAYAGGDEGDGLLEKGEQWVYTGHYSIVAGDPPLLSGAFTATGTDRDRDPVTARMVYHLQTVEELYWVYLPAIQNGSQPESREMMPYLSAIRK